MPSAIDQRATRRLARLGTAIGEPSRAAMLVALLGGVALPASQLARVARVTPQTATEHLRHLCDAGILTARQQGRHRYYAIASSEVAEAVERLTSLGKGLAVGAARPEAAQDALSLARTCYRHLAGRLGVCVADRLVALDALAMGRGATGTLTEAGAARLVSAGIATGIEECAGLEAKPCLDWTERRTHFAGPFGVWLADRLLALRWVARIPGTRALRVTSIGERGFGSLGVPVR